MYMYTNKETNKQIIIRYVLPVCRMIQKRRMSMLGHMLRLDDDTPPRKAMESYLAHTGPGRRGRPLTTLATTIKQVAIGGVCSANRQIMLLIMPQLCQQIC